MRKQYKNALAEAIASSSLNLTDFNFDEKDGKYTVLHSPSDNNYYFSIKVNGSSAFTASHLYPLAGVLSQLNGMFSLELSPGEIASTDTINCSDWDALMDCFNLWLERVEEEIDTPDLWAEAAKTAQLFAPTAEPSDDKFNRSELAQVQSQLRLLQQNFTASALPEAVKQKLIELTKTAAVAAENHTKRDWLGMLVGSFTGAVFSLALNPSQTQEVIKLVKAVFGGLFLH